MSETDPRAIQNRMRGFRRHAAGSYRWVAVAEVAASLLLIVQAWSAATVINAVFLDRRDLSDVTGWLAILAAASLARAGMAMVLRDRGLAAAVRIKQVLRDRLLARWLDDPRDSSLTEGAMASVLTDGVERTEGFFGRYLPQQTSLMIRPAAVVLAVLAADQWSGLLLLVTGPLIPVFMILIGDAAQKQSDRQWSRLQRMSGHLLDQIRGLPTLVELGASDRSSRIREVSEQYRTSTMTVLRTAFLSGMVLELAASLSTAVVAVSIGVRLIEGVMTYAPALFVLILTPEFYLPFRQFGAERHAAMDAVASGRDLVEDPGGVRAEAPRSLAAPPDPGKPPALAFDNVTYTYPGRDTPALQDVSLTLAAGRTHVLAGPSGAGKSTLMKLLLRQIELGSGAVTVDGLALASLSREAWRRRVTWISQKPLFVHGTVADNLRVACPGAARADLLAAFDRAGLRNWVEALPLGLDTRIGEEGLQFSGGQRQRLALARAFLRPAPLLLLDEPESGLDPESERDMAVAMGRLAEGRTVLIIAHRRHTLRRADQVIWLADGRVVDVGPPDAVLARREGGAS